MQIVRRQTNKHFYSRDLNRNEIMKDKIIHTQVGENTWVKWEQGAMKKTEKRARVWYVNTFKLIELRFSFFRSELIRRGY